MIKFDVLKSFAKAALIDATDNSEDEGSTSSGSGGYGGPGQENGILVPYNFSFS